MNPTMLKIISLITLALNFIIAHNNDQETIPGERKFIDITIIDEIINGIKIKNKHHLSKLLNETDSTYMMYYYTKKSNNSIIGAVHLQMIDRKLDYLAKILFVDCGEVEIHEFPICKVDKNLKYDIFPRIKLLIPNGVKFDENKEIIPHTEIGFNKEYVSDKNLYEYITENIISYSRRFTSETFHYLEKQHFFNKVILFTEKESTPLIYRGLSNYFYDRIIFAEVGKNETDLMERFNIDKFPTILVIENNFFAKENPLIHKYEGLIFIGELKKFIEKYAYEEKHYMVRLNDNKAIKNKVAFLNKENYDEFFEENKNEKKIVYFHEDEHDYNDEFSIPEALKELFDLSVGFFKFASLNCRKIKNICTKNFYVDKLPSLVFYSEDVDDDYFKMMKKSFQLPLIKKDLFKSISLKYESKFNRLQNSNMEDFKKIVSKTKEKNQQIVFFFYDQNANLNSELLVMKLISNIPNIEKKVAIYAIETPDEDLKNYLKITNYPYLITILHEQKDRLSIKKIPLNLKDVDNRLWYLDIKIFIENNVGLFYKDEKKRNINPDYDYLQVPQQNIRKFKEAYAELDFRKNCLHNVSGKCLILFLNGEFYKDLRSPNLKFKKDLYLMNEIVQADDYKSFTHLYYVNATCHDELAGSFKVGKSNLPSLIFYNTRYHLYQKLTLKFKQENIYEFLDKMTSSNLPGNKIEPRDIKFDFKNCKRITNYAENIDFERIERIKYGLEDDDNIEELNIPDDSEKVDSKMKEEI